MYCTHNGIICVNLVGTPAFAGLIGSDVPLDRMSGLQCFNMGHNGHGINLYAVSMTLMGINMQADNLA